MNAHRFNVTHLVDDDVRVTGVVVKASRAGKVVDKSSLLLERYREAVKKRRDALEQQAAVSTKCSVAPVNLTAPQAADDDSYSLLLKGLRPLGGYKRPAAASFDDADCPTKRTVS